MRQPSGATLLGLSVAGAIVAAAPGNAAVETDEAIVRELGNLNRSLASIAATLERIERKQDVVVVLRRIEIKERKLLALESALRGAQSTLQGLNLDVGRMEAYLESTRDQLTAAIREGAVGPEAEAQLKALRDEEAEAVRMVETRKREIEQTEQRVRELEDDLGDLRDDVGYLEELLDAQLETGEKRE